VPTYMYAYYCRTYEKAVSGGEREKRGHLLKDTTSLGLRSVFDLPDLDRRPTSRGLCVTVRVRPHTTESLTLDLKRGYAAPLGLGLNPIPVMPVDIVPDKALSLSH